MLCYVFLPLADGWRTGGISGPRVVVEGLVEENGRDDGDSEWYGGDDGSPTPAPTLQIEIDGSGELGLGPLAAPAGVYVPPGRVRGR